MGQGFLKVQLYTGDYALHGQQMAVQITKDGVVLHTLETDENGATERIALEAPDLSMGTTAPGADLFETYDVIVPEAKGYMKVTVYGVQIFDGITSILNIHMEPLSEAGPQEIKIYVPKERGASIFYENGEPGSHLAMPVWEAMTHPIYNKGASIRNLRTQMPRTIAAAPDNYDMTTLLLALLLLMNM